MLWVASAASAADVAPPPAAGPITLDMTIAQAKQSTPAVQWKDVNSRFTGKTLSITAENVWTLEGHVYRVRFRQLSHNATKLELHGQHVVDSPDVCRARVAALAEHFGRFFENLEPRVSPWDQLQPSSHGRIVAQRTPEGLLVVTGQLNPEPESESGISRRILFVGSNAQVREVAVRDTSVSWDFIKHASHTYHYSIGADASYRHDEMTERRTCRIDASLQSHPEGRPVFETLEAKIKPVATPSAAVRRKSIVGLALPPEGIELKFRCGMVRETGRLVSCDGPKGSDRRSPEVSAAYERLREYRYDPRELDPDNDLSLFADVTITLSPSDRDPAP